MVPCRSVRRVSACKPTPSFTLRSLLGSSVTTIGTTVGSGRLGSGVRAAPTPPPTATAIPPARFLVKSGGHYTVVAEGRVLYFASEEGLTKLVADGAHFWMDPTLNDLEQRLDPARFFRISRAAMVNLAAVGEVHPMPGGAGEVRLKNGERLEVSRRRYRELLAALGAP